MFLVQSKNEPYGTSIVELDDDAKALGERKCEQARRLYVECTSTGKWPGYDGSVHRVSLPAWVYAEDMEDAS